MRKAVIVFGINVLLIILIIPSVESFAIEESEYLLSNGKVLYVGGNGPGNFSKIQDAINNASDGDTIFVYSGTYDEIIIVNKSVDLIGQNKSDTIIKGIGSGDVVHIYVSWVTIKNFKINNSGHFWVWHVKNALVNLITSTRNRIYCAVVKPGFITYFNNGQ